LKKTTTTTTTKGWKWLLSSFSLVPVPALDLDLASLLEDSDVEAASGSYLQQQQQLPHLLSKKQKPKSTSPPDPLPHS
jgi:hypothetical protein